jgi:hypothetical protein
MYFTASRLNFYELLHIVKAVHSAAHLILLCRRTLGWNSGLLLMFALEVRRTNTRLDIINNIIFFHDQATLSTIFHQKSLPYVD